MAVIAVVSQKGGVSKSSLARAIGREIANNDLTIKIADLDAQQTSTADWYRLRLSQGHNPDVPTQAYGSAAAALREAEGLDFLVIDAPARASKATLELARKADLVIQPTGSSLDDLRPAVRLFHELRAAGIHPSKLCFALCRIGTEAEESEARVYLDESGYTVLEGYIPEKPAYRIAQNSGRAITEVSHRGLRKRADCLISNIARKLDG